MSAREDAAAALTATASVLTASLAAIPPGPWSIAVGLGAALSGVGARLLSARGAPARLARVSSSRSLLEQAVREQAARVAVEELYDAAERERAAGQ